MAGLDSRMEKTEERISGLEGGAITVTQSEQGKQTNKNEQSLRDIGDSNKRSNIHVIEVPEGEEKKREGPQKERMSENFPNLAKNTSLHI